MTDHGIHVIIDENHHATTANHDILFLTPRNIENEPPTTSDMPETQQETLRLLTNFP